MFGFIHRLHICNLCSDIATFMPFSFCVMIKLKPIHSLQTSSTSSNIYNSSPTSNVEDYAILHAMEPENVVTTNTIPELPELHIPEVEDDFNLDTVLLSGDVEMDLLDRNLVSENDQDLLSDANVDKILLGTFDSIPDMLNAFASEGINTDEEQPKTDNVSKRHRKGPKRQNLEDELNALEARIMS